MERDKTYGGGNQMTPELQNHIEEMFGRASAIYDFLDQRAEPELKEFFASYYYDGLLRNLWAVTDALKAKESELNRIRDDAGVSFVSERITDRSSDVGDSYDINVVSDW